MNIYGDRGNILALIHNAAQRGIETELIEITESTANSQLERIDLFVGGGAQDKDQDIAFHHCKRSLGEGICDKLEHAIPALFVCGSYQLFGKSYKDQKGLGFFPCITRTTISSKRLVGDLLFKATATPLKESPLVIGFENHRLQTYLDGGVAFGEVLRGYGNNGEDRSEGIFYKNAIGTYAHGPLLPKNPFLTDWLLQKALEIRYKKPFEFEPLHDPHVESARDVLLKRLLH